jgi:hypothetical protein
MIMKQRRLLAPILIAALGAAVQPAAADVTARQLYDAWEARDGGQGRTVEAETVTDRSDGLTLEGLSIVQETSEGRFTARLDRVVMTDDAGAVIVSVPSGQTVAVTASGDDTAPVKALLRLDEGPLTLRATGDPGAVAYDVAADALAVELTSLSGEGVPEDATFEGGVTGLTGTLEGLTGDAAAEIAGDLVAETARMNLAYTDPATGDRISTAVAQSELEVAMALRPGAEAQDWAVDLSTSSGPAQATTRQVRPGAGVVETESRQAATRLSLSLEEGRGDYATSAEGLSLTVRADGLPISPVSVEAAAADLAMSVPTATGETPQLAEIRVDVQSLMPGEAIWQSFDPTGALPRRPANLALDAEADVVVSEESGAMLPPAAGMPGVLPRGLRINELSLDFGDAEIDAEGDFTVEAVDEQGGLTQFGQPAGTLTVTARGVMDLLGQLITAGVLSEDQAMGAQMMIGMFATQAEDGTLTSEITTESDGGLIVNGQRLR